MKASYNSKTDTLRLMLNNAPIEESDEVRPRVILDYDEEGNVVELEILDASARTDNPRTVEYAAAG